VSRLRLGFGAFQCRPGGVRGLLLASLDRLEASGALGIGLCAQPVAILGGPRGRGVPHRPERMRANASAASCASWVAGRQELPVGLGLLRQPGPLVVRFLTGPGQDPLGLGLRLLATSTGVLLRDLHGLVGGLAA
jgi:hypothetical protein